MRIDSYSFGHMVVDGRACTKDLILLPDRLNVRGGPTGRRVIHRPDADHDHTGILALFGDAFVALPENPSLTDLTPNVLYLQGCPFPDASNGRVWMEAIAEDVRQLRGPPQRRRYDDEPVFLGPAGDDDDAVMERLRALGYV